MVSGRYCIWPCWLLVLHQVNQTFHGRPPQGHSLTLDFAEHSSVTLMDPTIIIRRRTFSLVYTTIPKRNYHRQHWDCDGRHGWQAAGFLLKAELFAGYEYKWECSPLPGKCGAAGVQTCQWWAQIRCRIRYLRAPISINLTAIINLLDASYLRIWPEAEFISNRSRMYVFQLFFISWGQTDKQIK